MKVSLKLAILFVVLAGALPAQITVINLDDSGQGSLRQAIADAQPWDTIEFAVTGIIVLQGEPFAIGSGKELTIQGPGTADLTIDADSLSHVFEISGGANVTIRDIAITGGGVGGLSQGTGSGLFVTGAGTSVTLVGCSIHENSADGPGGGLAVLNGAEAVLEDCSVTGNLALGNGGGIYAAGDGVSIALFGCSVSGNTTWSSGGGLAVLDGVEVVLDASFITDNQAPEGHGGGLYVSGSNPPATVNAVRVLFADNLAEVGGGLAVRGLGTVVEIESVAVVGNTAVGVNGVGEGGGMSAHAAVQVMLKNVTMAQNQAIDGGGGLGGNGGGLYFKGNNTSVTLTHVTIADNAADTDGGGIYQAGGVCVLTSALVAKNAAGGLGPDLSGFFASGGYNLIGNGAGSDGLTDGLDNDRVGGGAAPVNPMLGDLGMWGGLTPTMPLLANSPAIDAGNPESPPQTDQRGVARGPLPDIGAFERAPAAWIRLAPGSVLTEVEPGDFALVLDAGGAVGDASVEITSVTGIGITVSVTPPSNPPAGMEPPPVPPPGPGPFILTWGGSADAANGPGSWLWRVSATNDAGETAEAFVVITIDGGGSGGGGLVAGRGGGCVLGGRLAPAAGLWAALLILGVGVPFVKWFLRREKGFIPFMQ